MKAVLLEIITPEKIIFSEQAISLVCESDKGKLGILPGHAGLIARLKPGKIRVTRTSGTKQDISTDGGFIEVSPGNIKILVEKAVKDPTVNS